MKRIPVRLTAVVVAALSASWVLAADASPAAPGGASTQPARTVQSAFPHLASGGLTYATLGELPKGTVLRAGEVTVTEKEIADQLAKAPDTVRDQLRRNAFFLLSQTATRALVLREAKAVAAKDGKDLAQLSEGGILQAYFEKLTAGVKVSDAEVADFYASNRDMMGGAKLDQVKPQIEQFLRQEKQQKMVDEHVKSLGRRVPILVCADWAKQQAALAMDNPVDKARASGKPSLVDFGAQGCRPCDMLAPILETLRRKYEGRANVVFVSVREEQILASRYGIQAIPVQIFFDKDGKEVFRHTGFWPQEELEKKLGEMGAR